MSEKHYRLAELRVGIVVLASLAILIFALFVVIGDIPLFRKETIIRTYMSSVEGLRPGAEVRLSGLLVGDVKDILFDGIPRDARSQQNVEIVMEIRGKLNGLPAVDRIRTDSIAVLKSTGLLGDNIIDITPGTLNGVPIQNGGTIKSQEQKSVGDIINASQAAVSKFDAISTDIKEMSGLLREGKGTLGLLINDDAVYVNLNQTILQAERLLTSIRQGQGTAGRLINDPALYNQAEELVGQLKRMADQVDDRITSGKGTLGKLIKDEELYDRTNALAANLDGASARLERTLARIERGEGTIGKLITDERLYDDTRDLIARLDVITSRLERGEGTAGLLLTDDRLYRSLTDTSVEITRLIHDFRQNPKQYLSIKMNIF
jgi:phospholipid/cholesterol/gamma-HCH transport system substrate-binding protein